jgi:hypothetical protein
MNDSRVHSPAMQICMLASHVICVAALTFAFNLFGALSTAIVAGLMTGVSRRWKWQTVVVSLVSPAVVLLLGQITRNDVDLRQRLSLAAVCFGAFWGTYLMTLLLMCLEKKSVPSESDAAPTEPATAAAAGGPIIGTALPSHTGHDLCLRYLQGTWLCETSPSGPAPKKMFAVKEDKFSLTLVNSGGASVVAHGDVIVHDKEAAGTSIIFEISLNKSASPG